MLINVSEDELAVIVRLRTAESWQKMSALYSLRVPYPPELAEEWTENTRNRIRREAEETIARMLHTFDKLGTPVNITYRQECLKDAERRAAREIREFEQEQRRLKRDLKQICSEQLPQIRNRSPLQIFRNAAAADPDGAAVSPADRDPAADPPARC